LVKAGDVAAVREALKAHGVLTAADKKQVLNDVTESHGVSLLSIAASRNDTGMMYFLINAGADTKARFGSLQMNALQVACCMGQKEAVTVLLENVQGNVGIDDVDSRKETAFSLSVRNNHPHLLPILIEAGSNGMNIGNQWGCLPIHYAAVRGDATMVQAILSIDKAQAQAVDTQGRSALFHAAQYGQEAVLQVLKDAGVDLLPAIQYLFNEGFYMLAQRIQTNSMAAAPASEPASAPVPAADRPRP
jgi:ankyrin repeat protein